MPYKPKPIKQIYFTRSEVAEKVGIMPGTLDNWRRQINLKIKDIEKGCLQRYKYTQKHIEAFKKIKELKEKGYRVNYIVDNKLWK